MKCKLSISVGEKTADTIRRTSEEMEITNSAFITMLVNNWEKEQRAMEIMNNMEHLKKMIEVANGERRDKEEN